MKDISKELESAKATLKDGFKIRLGLNIVITVNTIDEMLQQIANVTNKLDGYEILYGGFDQIYEPKTDGD
jgi:hypothetical protein